MAKQRKRSQPVITERGVLLGGLAREIDDKSVRRLILLVVEERRKQFEAGEEWALLDAVDVCLRTGMPVPLWAATLFASATCGGICSRRKAWMRR